MRTHKLDYDGDDGDDADYDDDDDDDDDGNDDDDDDDDDDDVLNRCIVKGLIALPSAAASASLPSQTRQSVQSSTAASIPTQSAAKEQRLDECHDV